MHSVCINLEMCSLIVYEKVLSFLVNAQGPSFGIFVAIKANIMNLFILLIIGFGAGVYADSPMKDGHSTSEVRLEGPSVAQGLINHILKSEKVSCSTILTQQALNMVVYTISSEEIKQLAANALDEMYAQVAKNVSERRERRSGGKQSNVSFLQIYEHYFNSGAIRHGQIFREGYQFQPLDKISVDLFEKIVEKVVLVEGTVDFLKQKQRGLAKRNKVLGMADAQRLQDLERLQPYDRLASNFVGFVQQHSGAVSVDNFKQVWAEFSEIPHNERVVGFKLNPKEEAVFQSHYSWAGQYLDAKDSMKSQIPIAWGAVSALLMLEKEGAQAVEAADKAMRLWASVKCNKQKDREQTVTLFNRLSEDERNSLKALYSIPKGSPGNSQIADREYFYKTLAPQVEFSETMDRFMLRYRDRVLKKSI